VCEVAVHINYCYIPEPEHVTGEVTEIDRQDLERAKEFQRTATGYAVEQGTRPSTIGLVLGSNPVALLAWYIYPSSYHILSYLTTYLRIGEKFLDWSDTTPDLDTIIETVALYWFTDTISSSFYNYR
jgi:microsomal epoxide hydrolase